MSLSLLKDFEASDELEALADRAREASDFLKALSHEARLLVLCILAEGEKSVTELEQILGERQSTVSQQLARLRFDRLVRTRREGKTIYYSLASKDVRTMLHAIYAVFCSPACEKRIDETGAGQISADGAELAGSVEPTPDHQVPT